MKTALTTARHSPAFLLFCLIFPILMLWLGFSLLTQFRSEQALYQELVSLGNRPYDASFLKEARKLPGLYAVAPVLEIPIRLRADESYSMDVTVLGVSLDELSMRVVASSEVPLGNTPTLLLGTESLSAMTDFNGHALSETQAKEYLEHYDRIEWSYCLVSEDSADGGQQWLPCRIAGILSRPSEYIFLSWEQACSLAGTAETLPGLHSATSVKKILLTVRGEQNFQSALALFQ